MFVVKGQGSGRTIFVANNFDVRPWEPANAIIKGWQVCGERVEGGCGERSVRVMVRVVWVKGS